MSMTSRRLRAGLLALSLSAALALPVAAATVDIPYSEFTLPNGLRVIVHEDHKAPIVAVNLWYQVGSKDELPGKTGFAHLYEHLMFEDSEHHKGTFMAPFEKVGATDQNGTTNNDRTNFFENVPTTALDMALWMESDRMGHLLGGIGKPQLDQQRGVVENEKREDENQPFGHVDDLIHADMYPVAHPYHHTTIGSKVDLDAASLDDVKAWFHNWYGPNNCVLVLAGDIDLATAKAKVTRYFGDIPASATLPKQQTWVAERKQTTRQTMLDHTAQPRIYRVWNVPAFGNDDLARLELFAQVLGGSQSSRLDIRLVHHDKLADHVSAYVDDSELGSQFYITADVKKDVDPAKVEAIIGEELAKLLKDGPTAAETARAKTVFQAGFIRGIERIGGFGGKADALAQCATFIGDPGCFRKRLHVYSTATPVQLALTGRRWLSHGDLVLTVMPVAEGKAPPEAKDDSTAKDHYATLDRPAPKVDPKFTTVKTDVDRSKGMPEVTAFPELKFPALQRATLSNGMHVILAERHEVPVVQMNLDFRGGYASDAADKPGAASFAMRMHHEGAGSYDALALGDREEELGAQIGSSASLDSDSFYLSALKDQLDPSLALYADVALRPTYDPKEIDRVRKTWIAGIAQEKKQPTALAFRLLPPLLYGAGHPYAIPFTGSGTVASISALTRDDLTGYDQRWLRPDNATAIVVGDTTLKEIVPLLEKNFGAWKAPSSPLPTVKIADVAAPTRQRVFLVDQPGAIQATILAGHVVRSAREVQPYWDFTLANEILGGQFSARLNMNLREDKHWAYGSYSFTPAALGQQPWIALAQVQIDKTAPALAEMRREIDDYVDGKAPATADELTKVKASDVRSLPGGFETAAAVLGQIASINAFHRPDDYAQNKPKIINAVTLEAAQAAIKDIHPDGLTWVVVGDLSKIEAPVRALNLGEVSVIDADGKPVAAKPAAPAAAPAPTKK